MSIACFLRSAADLVTQVAQTIVDHLIHRPLHGLAVVSEGLSLIVPDLVNASTAAAVQAITSQLSVASQNRIRLGRALIGRGLHQLAWPLMLVGVILLARVCGSFGLLAIVVLLAPSLTFQELRAGAYAGAALPNGWRVVWPSPS